MERRTPPLPSQHRLSNVLDRISLAIRRRFEIDLRALAAFRIALAALVLVDLARRSRHLTAFYTDAGVLPREALFSDYSTRYSVHAMVGEAWAQALLFLLAGAVAVALLVGYRTRIAAIASWLLLMSLHARNPMVLNGGDVLFRLLLFWGMFLPLGARWSIDAVRTDRTRERSTVATAGTMALLLQVMLMYGTNAVHKFQGDLWTEGEAVVYIFQLDQFTILLGNALADQFALLRAFTYAWIVLLALTPLLLLLTGVPRAALASAFAGMHLGMLVTMRLDLFPLVVVAGLLPFYPPIVWDAVSARLDRLGLPERLRRRATGIGDVGLPRPTLDLSLPDVSRARTAGRELFATVLPFVFLVLVVLSNAQAVGVASVPDRGEQVLDVTETDQSWRMFAPEPLRTDGWYVAPAHLENGTEVDAFRGGEVDWDRPPSVEETYPSARWRKYLSNVWSADNKNHQSYFADYLCDRWNREHDVEAANVSVYYQAQSIEPYNETDPINEYKLHEHDCSGDLLQ